MKVCIQPKYHKLHYPYHQDYTLCHLTIFSCPSYWELGAAVHCIAQAETGVLCPSYLVCLGHSVLIAIHHRGLLERTASLQATSSCPVGTSVIKASPGCQGHNPGSPQLCSPPAKPCYHHWWNKGGAEFGWLQHPDIPSSVESASGVSGHQNLI